MNRIKHAYDSVAPDKEKLLSARMDFINKVEAMPAEQKERIKTHKNWHIAVAAAACLIIATVSIGAFTGKMSIANTMGNISDVEELGIDLPEMVGDFKQASVMCHNWVGQGDLDPISIINPLYRNYTVSYDKPFDIVWQDLGPLNDPSGFNGVHAKQSIHVSVGSSKGFSSEDWERFAGYDSSTKKWIPYTLFEDDNSTVSYENIEEIEYRGATIWIYDVMTHYKKHEPGYCSDAGAHWYDPETECYFQIRFSSPSYDENTSESYDKDGKLLHKANEQWIREYSYLSKAELLGYIKELIDLNR